MLFDESEEFGLHKGLGLIPGRVVRIPDVDADGSPQRVPHISWNPLYPAGGRTDFSGTALQNVTAGTGMLFYPLLMKQSPQRRNTAWPIPCMAAARCAPLPKRAA